MARRNQFVCDAESVQGIEGAEITFKKIQLGTRQRYFDREDEYRDAELLREHILDWKGIVDDEGHEIPSPKDQPGVEAVLYWDEVEAIVNLFFQGTDGEHAKN